ncbi:DUF6705 family protein [Flavobacterium cerinum]|uniref:DUF6705 domain-containing protein n=1 Tax=Flavobacterium cerinum TaxID=2502784 RepID=A0A444HCG1_9FLAO|nr:DUF6705 family protein [Flavobacterium cerinum]RWX01056.1 hypothetical protein EPI11_08525 [Flavobacterium cerinum]
MAALTGSLVFIMKRLILFLIILPFWNCKAQSPIKSLYNDPQEENGAYYKDFNNELDTFVGTWKYTNGSTSLTITLKKKVMQFFSDGDVNFYEDILIGEYKYIENGVEKINTLSQLLVDKNPYKYNIVGNIFYEKTNKNLQTNFSDPNREIQGMTQAMFFDHVNNDPQKLFLTFKMMEGPYTVNDEPLPYTSYTVPFGEYLLVKQ